MKHRAFFVFLLVECLSARAARIDTMVVFSKAMKKDVPNLVVIPDGYADGKKKYPVVYLLHGAGGDYSAWLTNIPDIKEHADTYQVILVCPDGGVTSWYFDSPVDKEMRYETFVADELVAAVDKKYNTVKNRSGRAITGYSMGGHGAFYLAFKHQDIWGAAGSLSGGLDIRPFPTNWDIAKRLGSYKDNKENWERNTVINLVNLLQDDRLKLIFDCGIDDFFYVVNKNMHQLLLESKIPHDYIERPGGHDFAYWTNAIKYQLVFFDEFFKLK